MTPPGALVRLTAGLGELAGALRRGLSPSAQVRLYDARGQARTVDPAAAEGRRILEAAEAMLDVAAAAGRERRSGGDGGRTGSSSRF